MLVAVAVLEAWVEMAQAQLGVLVDTAQTFLRSLGGQRIMRALVVAVVVLELVVLLAMVVSLVKQVVLETTP